MDNQDLDSRPVLELRNNEPESTRAYFKRLFSWFDKAVKWTKFKNTRRRIKHGEKLFDLPADELLRLKVMGPLTFNAYETVLAAVPAQVLTKILNFYVPYEAPQPQIPDSLSLYWKALFRNYSAVAPSVEGFLSPFIAPILLLTLASLFGWASLRKEDCTKQSRKRCRNAYLYYNGAYGLLPQAITSLPIIMLIMSYERNVYSAEVLFVPLAILAVMYFYNLHFILDKISGLLFKLNGYSSGFVSPGSGQVAEPWGKYLLSALFLSGPVVFVVLIVFLAAEGFLILVIAAIGLWLRGPI